MIHWLRHHWRDVMARLPLPTLALAASYGVYSYALLFVPWWVAVIQAAAFELTYLGLSTVDVPERWRRRRAAAISLAAVSVSVVYNSAAGYFHRNPAALSGLSFVEELALAVAHGAPLAIVAYLVADLLLHTYDRRVIPAQRRALIRRLMRIVRELRVSLANAQALISDQAREFRESRLLAARESGELREQLEQARAQAREAHAEVAKLREQARDPRNIPANDPPTRARVVAYVREQVDGGRSRLDVARELGFADATLRGWMEAEPVNGVEVLN